MTQVEAEYFPSETWGLSWSGQLGGSFFDFNSPGVSGKLEEMYWTTRLGVDWVHGLDAGRLYYVGLGYEYGESRSWLENLQASGFSEDGPRTILAGASARAGIGFRPAERLLVVGELVTGAYHGRAEIESLRGRYNWLGRSIGASVGLRYVVVRPRSRSNNGG